MKKYNYLIVGAGLFGSIFAFLANRRGDKCLVIDKRPHLGGNVYCEDIEGINVHKYGAHIFHTSNEKIWKFVNSIVPFNRYTNSPLANYKGKLYNLPFNMNTFHQLWGINTPDEAKRIIEQQKLDAIAHMKAEGIVNPRSLEEQAKILVGHDIYEILIKGYTEKQWGRQCKELPPFIIRRLPVRFTFDNNYFDDNFQGIPIGGYNNLIQGLLEGIDVRTNINYLKNRDELEVMAEKIVYTGALDEYFDYIEGKLQYRTVRFETEVVDKSNYQGNAVVNYTDKNIPYTRIIEHKHFECFGQDVYNNPRTVISREFSIEWKEGMEPYYPINDKVNSLLYSKYQERARQIPNMIYGGRLAEYKYYDMAPTIENAFKILYSNCAK